MADKTTSLTSHSLFPASNDGLALGEFPGSFSFAPTLLPTSTAPPVETASPENISTVTPLNTGKISDQ